MNMRFNFFTLLVYSPRGKSANALKSQRLLGSCKNGDIRFAEMLANKIISEKETVFFENSVFIPIPRSTPLVMGAVFPAKTLAETLVSKGIGNTVLECLKRTKKIPKSSNQFSADERNSVQVHLDSLQITPLIISEPTIIIIDDVFTLGRTAMASAIKLREVYPDKEIKIFAPFRTRSFNDNNILVEIDHQEMILSPYDKVILPN